VLQSLGEQYANQKQLPQAQQQPRVVVPALKARDHWFVFCFGREAYQLWCERAGCRSIFDPEEAEEEAAEESVGAIAAAAVVEEVEEEEEEGTAAVASFDPAASAPCLAPSTALLLQMDHVMAQRVLKHLDEWLAQAARSDTAGFCVSPVDTEFNLRQCEYLYSSYYYSCQWTYALLARIERPLHKDSSAVIRALCRTGVALRFLAVEYCLRLRTGSRGGAEGGEVVVSPAAGAEESDSAAAAQHYLSKLVSMLNTLILVCGVYFGQGGDILAEEN
jgi:hypothetical protein